MFFQVAHHGVDKILEDEFDSYGSNSLTEYSINNIYLELNRYLEQGYFKPFQYCYSYQKDLFKWIRVKQAQVFHNIHTPSRTFERFSIIK